MAATKAAKAAAAKNEVVSDSKDLVEDVKELVGDGVELLEDSVELAKRTWISRSNTKVLIAGAALVGVVAGGALTYLVVSKRLSAKYQAIADDQVADVKKKYTVRRLTEEKPDLDALAEQVEQQIQVEQVINHNGYTRYDQVPPAEDVVLREEDDHVTVTQAIVEATSGVERNVFESDHPDSYFDLAEELQRRETYPDKPHVITQEEFNQNDTGYDQTTMTYFEADDVLVDENNQQIPNIENTVGMENILRFGHGSGDPSIVYVSNPKLGLDIELAHSDGSYVKEVLGFDDSTELKHSDRRQRRMRNSDE